MRRRGKRLRTPDFTDELARLAGRERLHRVEEFLTALKVSADDPTNGHGDQGQDPEAQEGADETAHNDADDDTDPILDDLVPEVVERRSADSDYRRMGW